MKRTLWDHILYVFIIIGFSSIPLQSQAEAEPIYVSGLDLDYMEPNQLFSWIEEVRYTLGEASPLIKNLLEAENDLLEAQTLR
ncbi:MAG: hypothetical protein KAG20_08190 [Cocleimonas sp.]|nr:hypothetical protein [Cocleimonas sp.]